MAEYKMSWLDKLAIILLVIGGLNWGLVGVFNYNLVGSIFGMGSMLSNIVYDIVGLAALYEIYAIIKMMSK